MALDGIKVLELASFWAGPTAGMYLADHGADVIKIESPSGDECRRFTSRREHGNESPSFLVTNRNKRGMVVDLRLPAARELLHRLVTKTDVVIHNYREAGAKKMGIRYEDLEPINPGLIYVHVSAYGDKGPMALFPGYDLVCQGLAGQMERRDGDGRPVGPGMFATDGASGLLLAYGVALALLERHKTGRGQKVQTSLLQMAIAIQHVNLVHVVSDPPADPAASSRSASMPYLCSDGKWVLPVPVGDKQFHSAYRVLGDERLRVANYGTAIQRAERVGELIDIFTESFAVKPRDEWVRRFIEADVPIAPITDRAEVFDLEQVQANGMVVEEDHPTMGRHRMTQVPLTLSKTPGGVRVTSPTQGQHTAEIMQELGYQDHDVEQLHRSGVLPVL